jgi:hypothetical protein
MARVYADVNTTMPRSYWDYDGVNISRWAAAGREREREREMRGRGLTSGAAAGWGAQDNYEVVRKIGMYEGDQAVWFCGRRRPNVAVQTPSSVLCQCPFARHARPHTDTPPTQAAESIQKSLRASTWLTTRSASSRC